MIKIIDHTSLRDCVLCCNAQRVPCPLNETCHVHVHDNPYNICNKNKILFLLTCYQGMRSVESICQFIEGFVAIARLVTSATKMSIAYILVAKMQLKIFLELFLYLSK